MQYKQGSEAHRFYRLWRAGHMHYLKGRGWTLAEIGEAHGIVAERVRVILKRSQFIPYLDFHVPRPPSRWKKG